MHKFIWGNDGVTLKYLDPLHRDDIVQANSELYGDLRFDDLKHIVVDLRDVETIDMDEEDVRGWITSFAARANPPNPRVKVAILAKREDICQLVLAYIDSTLEHLPHANQRLFHDEQTARAWAMAQ